MGALFIDQSIPKDMKAVEKDLSVQYGGTVEKGGHWAPTTCVPRKKVQKKEVEFFLKIYRGMVYLGHQ